MLSIASTPSRFTQDIRSQTWVATLNNWTTEEKDAALLLHGDLTYCVLGEEVGSSGTPHLQCYFETSKRVRISALYKMLKSRRYFLETRRGTQQQADAYCKKDGKFTTSGTLSTKLIGSSRGSGPGKTHLNDQLMALKEVMESDGIKGAFEADFPSTVRFHSGLSKFAALLPLPPRPNPPKVECFVGPTGTGKTRICHWFANRYYGGDIYVHGGNPKFFDGYTGQKCVLFDDFDGTSIPRTFLLRLLDRYPIRVEIKGGSVAWEPIRIFITSNSHPDRWFPVSSDPLLRRMDVVEVNTNLYFE